MHILIYLLWLVLSVVLQVLLFNHLSLMGGVVLIYMVALLKMPVEVNRVMQIVLGFLVGFMIDVFCNTPGMHSFAAVTTMFFRKPLLKLFNNDPEFKNGLVGVARIGLSSFLRYSLTIIAINCFLLYSIEAFSLFNVMVLLTKMILSTLLTFAVGMAFEFANMKK